MSMISRRAALAAFTAAPTALVASPARPEDDEWTILRSFLERASPAERMNYHLMRAAEAASEIRPGVWSVRHSLDHGFMMIVDYDHCRRQREDAEAALAADRSRRATS